MNKITSFRGEYAFLSNFYPLEKPAVIWGITFTTAEHLYHSFKTMDIEERRIIAAHPSKGLKAFVRNNITLREDWDRVKLEKMRTVVKVVKFGEKSPKLRTKLLATGNAELVEENNWNDTFWGICNGKGCNHLGKILMETRELIRSSTR